MVLATCETIRFFFFISQLKLNTGSNGEEQLRCDRIMQVRSSISKAAIGPRSYFRFSHVLVDPLSHLGSPQTVTLGKRHVSEIKN